jgi:hypothetical protein
MKADPEVKMISAEAPILFAKGCDIFITELTMRAWIHAEENKRRTLQRSDIASALAKSDMFDFLIDIVPREEAAQHAKRATGQGAAASQGVPAAGSTQLPPQHTNLPQQPGHPAQQHAMAPPDYSLGHGLAPDQDYRQQSNMYTAQVQPGPAAPYGAPQQQMYGEMEGIYGYPPMQAQQVYRCLASLLKLVLYHVRMLTPNSRCIMCPSVPRTPLLAKMRVIAIHDMMGEKVMQMRKEREIMKLANLGFAVEYIGSLGSGL